MFGVVGNYLQSQNNGIKCGELLESPHFELFCVDINCKAREDMLEGDTDVHLLVVMAACLVLFCFV